MGPLWYAVSVQYTRGESALQVIHVPADTLPLPQDTEIVHLGDTAVEAWGVYKDYSGPKLTSWTSF